MVRYIVRRLLWVVVLLFLVSLLTFVVFYVFPSADPAQLRAGRQPNPQLVEQIRHRLGLDQPWYVQYWRYMRALVLHFDFGRSYHYNSPVRKEIFKAVGPTASLAIGAAVIWLVSGILVGILSAVRRGRLIDRVSMGVALVAISAPVFWLGLVALYLFADDIGKLKLFPGAGSYPEDGLLSDPWTWFTSLLLPWMVLAASFAAFYARLLRGNLIETMSEDYIRTARAKGLSERRVVMRHGVRSAITPVVTAAGLDIGILLGGAILVERVFNIPGVGRLAYQSIQDSDLPMIQGTVLLGAFFIVLMNLVVDVLYAFLDPRVRYT
ncbi:MAG TPA: ABC transporter permease [Thermoleophilaceae bacterium]|nr:ABC transporter permease [Thermoleophilaceae bacterium]